MAREFMLYIRNEGDAKKALSSEEHLAFIKQCEVYIGQLQLRNQLIAAQPIVREGCIIRRNGEDWSEQQIDPTREVQVGYYHIRAADMEEAIAIARQNPEFAYVPSASIEVRPVTTKETATQFTYPSGT